MTDQTTAEGGAAPCSAAVAHRGLVVGGCGHGRGGVCSGLCAGKQSSGALLDGDTGCGRAFVRRWSGGVAVRLSRQRCAEAGASAARRSGAYHPARTGAGGSEFRSLPLDSVLFDRLPTSACNQGRSVTSFAIRCMISLSSCNIPFRESLFPSILICAFRREYIYYVM